MSVIPAMSSDAKKRSGERTVFTVVAGLFAIWGLALWLYNTLFFKFSEFFAFEPVHVAWALTLFHVAYFLLAMPAALFHRQFGYKLGFLFGLCIFALGAFLLYLGIVQQSSFYFLGAIVMTGSCGALLDTSLNPLAVEAGDPCTSTRRLNIAHAFNGLGLIAAYYTAIWLIEEHHLSLGATAQLSAQPYVMVGLGAIMLAFLTEQITLPAFATKSTAKASGIREQLRPLFADRTFMIAAAALFAYCVVLTILWTSSYNYRAAELPDHTVTFIERVALWFVLGRVAGTVLMRWIDPVRLLQWCTGLCLIAILVTAVAGGPAGWVSLISCSLFLSIIYPTVSGSALIRHPAGMKLAAGLLVTAAGIGSALSSQLVTLALHEWHLDARLVIASALPFLAIILAYARKAYSGEQRVPAQSAPPSGHPVLPA